MVRLLVQQPSRPEPPLEDQAGAPCCGIITPCGTVTTQSCTSTNGSRRMIRCFSGIIVTVLVFATQLEDGRMLQHLNNFQVDEIFFKGSKGKGSGNTTSNDFESQLLRLEGETAEAAEPAGQSAVSPSKFRTYHSWDARGADFQRVLQQLNFSWADECHVCEHQNSAQLKKLAKMYRPFPAFVAVFPDTQMPRLWLSQRYVRETTSPNGMWGAFSGFRRVLPHLQDALQIQLPANKHLFPSLTKTLQTFGLIPFFVDYGDYNGCPDPAWSKEEDVQKKTIGLPYFSIAKSNNCSMGFPMPTYTDYDITKLGKPSSDSSPPWIEQMKEWNTTYPWHTKLSQAYWRGTAKRYKSEREIMIAKANDASANYTKYFDIQPTNPNAKHPKEYSMKYKLVIDLDGNSWSERFPRLLCYNSAVIKITHSQEDFDEYMQKDLLPNVHYIPASIHNFTTVVQDLLTQDKDGFLKSLVANANAFCKKRIIPEQMNLDFLSLLDGYCDIHNRYNPYWIKEWEQNHAIYVGPDPPSYLNNPNKGHGGFTTNQPGETPRQDLLRTTKWIPP